jgi:arginase family enzyme
MQLYLLHLDDAFSAQPDFVGSCERGGARHLHAEEEGSAIRLWGKHAALERVSNRLRDTFAAANGAAKDEPKLCFMGSGDFHHVTALLLETTLSQQAEPITVIHFDNHPDWVHQGDGMHCGSWVNRAQAHPAVAKIITIGVTSDDLTNPDWKGANLSLLRDGPLELFPYDHAPSRVRHDYGAGASHRQIDRHIHWQTIEHMGEAAFHKLLLARIPTKNVYITIDKDVLSREDAETNWDQGKMRLGYLLSLLQAIGTNHRIVGADVNGDYSPPYYSGSVWTRLKKHAEIFIDQPHRCVALDKAAALNSASNHALLETLREVMA